MPFQENEMKIKDDDRQMRDRHDNSARISAVHKIKIATRRILFHTARQSRGTAAAAGRAGPHRVS